MKKFVISAFSFLFVVNVHEASAQLEYFDPVLSETARDGHIIYDRHFMPNKNDWQRMNLKDNVKAIVEEHNLKGGLTPGERSDTIKFNQDGFIEGIISPKKDMFNPDEKYENSIILAAYENKRPVRWLKGEDIPMANGKEYRVDLVIFEYTDRGELLTETHQYFGNKSGQMVLDSYQPTSSNWKYSYNIDQQIATGTTHDGSESITYENELLTDWGYVESDLKPTHFTYDSNGHIVSISRYECDYSCSEDNFQITRNEQGDITKVVHRVYKTNSKGVRILQQKPRLVETFTIAYTYDTHNNWTKAVVTLLTSGNRSIFYTIKRDLFY